MTPKRQWSILTALACVLVLVAGFLVLVKPQHSKAAAVQAQTATVQGEIQSLRAQLARLQEESRGLAAQQAALARLAQQLPGNPQLPTLLVKLDAAAKSAGVELVNVAPGNPTTLPLTPVGTGTAAPAVAGTAAPAATGTVAATAPAAAGSTVSGVAQIPVVLTVTGGYFQLERFLDGIEGLRRSMLVNSFSLAYKTSSGAGSTTTATIGKGELSATITAAVFSATAPLGTTGSATTAP